MSFRLFQRAPAVGALSIFCACLLASCVPARSATGGKRRIERRGRGRHDRHGGHDRERGHDGNGRD